MFDTPAHTALERLSGEGNPLIFQPKTGWDDRIFSNKVLNDLALNSH